MTVKQIYDSISSATLMTIVVAKSRYDCLDEKEIARFGCSSQNDIPEEFKDCEVEVVYPRKKDFLEVWIVKDITLEKALSKIGELARDYLTRRNKAMWRQIDNDQEKFASLNEGRIEGFLRCVKLLGVCTPNELSALDDYFLRSVVEDAETKDDNPLASDANGD